mmetsp:Transcript_98016/g.305249  ORF Transcript_98016/g.305249 Transcript_98016/m.305249 type:complete len:236 (+) Transcript_98016:398-1105(+)
MPEVQMQVPELREAGQFGPEAVARCHLARQELEPQKPQGRQAGEARGKLVRGLKSPAVHADSERHQGHGQRRHEGEGVLLEPLVLAEVEGEVEEGRCCHGGEMLGRAPPALEDMTVRLGCKLSRKQPVHLVVGLVLGRRLGVQVCGPPYAVQDVPLVLLLRGLGTLERGRQRPAGHLHREMLLAPVLVLATQGLHHRLPVRRVGVDEGHAVREAHRSRPVRLLGVHVVEVLGPVA